MTERSSQPVQNYLSRLDSALSGVAPDVRVEIVSGIREELAGLDDEAATARIAEMDDPALIAAEARAEQPGAEAEPAQGRTLSLVAVLVLIIGSFVVPVIGPLVGLVWVTLSKAWSRREKLVAWLAPIAAGVLVAPFASATGWHLAILIPFIVLPIEGVVLLIRAHGRGWRPRELRAH